MEMHVVLYVFKATFGCCCICTEDQLWVPPCLIIWSHYRITKFYVFAIGCKQLSFEFFIYLFIFLEKCFSGLYVCRSGAAKTMKPIGSLQE